PPNKGTVWASSTSRSGSSANASPSMRARAKGSCGSSTAAAMRVLVRSCTSPWSGPNTRTTGQAGSRLAMNPSTSAFLTATIGGRSGARDEERCQPRPNIVRNLLGGAVLGVPQAAGAREALGLARNVVAHARKGLAVEDGFAGLDVLQRV